LWLDGPLAFGGINSQVMAELTALAPFGPGNPKPIFNASNVQIVDGPRKLKDRHLKMSFRQDHRVFRAIAWNCAEREPLLTEKKDAVDLAFSLEENEFQGEKYLELRLEDFR
jgi:single-stranded-DNA-specific exonuclease